MSRTKRETKKKSVKDKLYRPGLVLLLVFGILFITVINLTIKRIAYNEAYRLSQVLASQNLAVHTFVNQEQKPSFLRTADVNSNDFFPELMSSTYMIRRINRYLDPYVPVHYYYKEVAVNARSPQNEAKDYEVEILHEFAKGEATEVKETLTLDHEKYFVYMRAGEVMEEDCIVCHGDPANAPAGLISLYGAERSFNRKPGELVSALSIRIPLQAAYAGANKTSLLLSLGYLAMLLLFSGSASSLLSKVVLDPVSALDRRVRNTLERFNCNSDDVVLDGDEIENVNRAFSFLEEKLSGAYDSLEQHAQSLEEKVQQRTRELQELNEQIVLACQNDWLLGIFNRGAFEKQAKAEFERMRREGRPISFLMVDLDHFKEFNDIYGHQAGDDALKKVATVISEQLRSYDLFGRYGGEELLVCLPATGREEALQVAARIVEQVMAAGIYHSGNPPYGKVTVSVGVASADNVKETHYEKLVNEADKNMYKAKETRNAFYPNL